MKKQRILLLIILMLSLIRIPVSAASLSDAFSLDPESLIPEEFTISDLHDLDMEELLSQIPFSDITIGPLLVPADSSRRSDLLALQLLGLCSGHTKDNTRLLFDSAGLEILDQVHYDKDRNDSSHTSAFTIGAGSVLRGFAVKKALVIAVRGTDGGEWYSNFDIVPSRKEEALFAENFLLCAEEIFLELMPWLEQETEDPEDPPLIIICGHSRGAACANLLGLLINAYQSPEQVYVYTFASPATIRRDTPIDADENIFNYINPCDIVPEVPFCSWNFTRAGTDILLSVKDPKLQEVITEDLEQLISMAPSVTDYYHSRLSLTSEGIDPETGLTPYEGMLLLVNEALDDTNTGLKDAQDLFSTDTISEDSPWRPMIRILEDLKDDDGALAVRLLNQHLPTTYLKLINELLTGE